MRRSTVPARGSQERSRQAVALIEPARGTYVRGSAGQGLDLHVHQSLGGEADPLAQKVGAGGLLQQLVEVHGLVGHRRVF